MSESSNISPRKLGVGPIQNFSSHTADSSRDAIKTELHGRLIFDDERVNARLRVSSVQQSLVDSCSNSFFIENDEAIQKLQALEEDAEKPKTAKAKDRQPAKEQGSPSGKQRETEMYPHLGKIFNYIQAIGTQVIKRPDGHRRFHVTQGGLLPEETHTIGFPEVIPDFSLMRPSVDVTSRLWSDRDGFCEIKAKKTQGPKPGRDGTIREIVTQAADYARLHMSSRPFLLFSVALLVFGSDFCLAIFDRSGVMFSPIKNMWTDTKDFIRAVLSITCVLSDAELGQDPTAQKLPPGISREINKDSYPSYLISPIGRDTRKWCTVGCPMWSSLSLLGRGTVVWRVLEFIDGAVPDPNSEKVIKTAWRDINRTSEAGIYEAIQGRRPGGLADFLAGGDVMSATDEAISVHSLRGHGDACVDSWKTPVLHRVLLNSVGRPLWEYDSELELLKAVRAACNAHRFLWDQNILHRDISAGNILLAKDSKTAQKGAEGFLTDLEFARTPASVVRIEEVAPVRGPGNIMTAATTRKKETFHGRGAIITGTLLFMAMDLLRGIQKQSQIQQTEEHDIESFIIVIAYAVLRHLVVKSGTKGEKETYDALMKHFRHAFGHRSIHHIIQGRKDVFEWLDQPIVRSSISYVFFQFLQELDKKLDQREMVRKEKLRKSWIEPGQQILKFQRSRTFGAVSEVEARLDHDFLYESLSITIEALENM